MKKYKILIEADILSSLPKEHLEEKLVVGLYDIEKEQNISDGDGKKLMVVDYNKTIADKL